MYPLICLLCTVGWSETSPCHKQSKCFHMVSVKTRIVWCKGNVPTSDKNLGLRQRKKKRRCAVILIWVTHLSVDFRILISAHRAGLAPPDASSCRRDNFVSTPKYFDYCSPGFRCPGCQVICCGLSLCISMCSRWATSYESVPGTHFAGRGSPKSDGWHPAFALRYMIGLVTAAFMSGYWSFVAPTGDRRCRSLRA